MLAKGIDPSAGRKAQKATKQARTANSFELVVREWFVKNQGKWVSSHADEVIRRLERDIFPWLGARPIAEVTLFFEIHKPVRVRVMMGCLVLTVD